MAVLLRRSSARNGGVHKVPYDGILPRALQQPKISGNAPVPHFDMGSNPNTPINFLVDGLWRRHALRGAARDLW